MPEVKFERVISFSSEDQNYKADNLLKSKKWRCQNNGESQVSVVLQLSKSIQINGIDIGNNGSAFVEIQVARQARPDDFKVILVASSFLTPIESRNENSLSRVRMFTADKLNSEIAKEKWDTIKAVCTQPFNKNIKYGLSFITVHSAEQKETPVEKPKKEGFFGAFKLKEEDEKLDVGRLFKNAQSKQSVATSMRSKETLASIAIQSSEAEKLRKSPFKVVPKRKNSEDLDEKPAKKKRENTPKIDKKLPKRNILDPGDSDNEDKPEPKKPKKETPKVEKPKKVIKVVKKPRKLKPFRQFMSDVVFTISGIQNPLRGDIRQKAIEMGAKYRGDWDNTCTHLVCAFVNTPKFNQVKGKGKIVKKDWIEQSYEDHKIYPWRRFCLDKNDRGTESDEEIFEDNSENRAYNSNLNAPSESSTEATTSNEAYDQDTDEEIETIKKKDLKKEVKKHDLSDGGEGDTDDEIERIKQNEIKQEVEAVKKPKKTPLKTEKVAPKTEKKDESPKKAKKNVIESMYGSDSEEEDDTKPKKEKVTVKTEPDESAYDQDTDDEIENIKKNDVKKENKDDPYEADTDVDEENENDQNLPSLPNYFEDKEFFIFGNFSTEKVRKSIIRGIIAGAGKIKEYMGPEVNIVISNSDFDKDFEDAKNVNPKVVFLRPSFIQECFDKDKFVSYGNHQISEK